MERLVNKAAKPFQLKPTPAPRREGERDAYVGWRKGRALPHEIKHQSCMAGMFGGLKRANDHPECARPECAAGNPPLRGGTAFP